MGPSRCVQKAVPRRSGRVRLAGFTGNASAVPAAWARQWTDNGQPRQRGARGAQTVAPRSIIAWAKSPGRTAGVIPAVSRRSPARTETGRASGVERVGQVV